MLSYFLQELMLAGLVDGSVMTVTGCTLAENLASVPSVAQLETKVALVGRDALG
jgi:dihydroxyacid dehydratase/phosphogluconate dehydratase